MHIRRTNFAKTLVRKHGYDVKLWRHKQCTSNTNDHHMPLNETSPMKTLCVRHCPVLPAMWNGRPFLLHAFANRLRKQAQVEMVRTAKYISAGNKLVAWNAYKHRIFLEGREPSSGGLLGKLSVLTYQ